MTTQYAVLNSSSGQAPTTTTLKIELFAINGNTVLYTSDTVSERTVAKTQYVGTFGESVVIPAGDYFALMTVVATGAVVASGNRTFAGTNGETATSTPEPVPAAVYARFTTIDASIVALGRITRPVGY